MSDAVKLIKEARWLMEKKTFALPVAAEEQREYWRMAETVKAFNARKAADGEALALLGLIYTQIGKCEFKYEDAEAFGDWGRRAYEEMHALDDVWFKAPKLKRISWLEALQKAVEVFGSDLDRDALKNALLQVAIITLFILTLFAWCCH